LAYSDCKGGAISATGASADIRRSGAKVTITPMPKRCFDCSSNGAAAPLDQALLARNLQAVLHRLSVVKKVLKSCLEGPRNPASGGQSTLSIRPCIGCRQRHNGTWFDTPRSALLRLKFGQTDPGFATLSALMRWATI